MRTLGTLVRMAPVALALIMVVHPPASAGLCGFGPFPPCGGTPAPEIDPSLLRGAIAMLTGGVLMLAGRRRSR
jgi:hypothetical protein